MSENSSKGSVSCRRFLKLETGVTVVGGMELGDSQKLLLTKDRHDPGWS